MRRNALNFVIDALTLLVLLAVVGTGLVLRYVLPPGGGGRGGGPRLELWGLGRHDWGGVHFWLAVGLVGLLVVHVALHWKWVCGTVRRGARPGVDSTDKPSGWTRNLWGLVFLGAIVLLVGGFLWLGQANVITAPGDGEAGWVHDFGGWGTDFGGWGTTSAPAAAERPLGENGRGHGGQHFRGSMTLREAAEEAGMSVDRVRELLSLPGDTSAEERLGRLGRERGFDMHTVRTFLEQHYDEGTGGNNPSAVERVR